MNSNLASGASHDPVYLLGSLWEICTPANPTLPGLAPVRPCSTAIRATRAHTGGRPRATHPNVTPPRWSPPRQCGAQPPPGPRVPIGRPADPPSPVTAPPLGPGRRRGVPTGSLGTGPAAPGPMRPRHGGRRPGSAGHSPPRAACPHRKARRAPLASHRAPAGRCGAPSGPAGLTRATPDPQKDVPPRCSRQGQTCAIMPLVPSIL